MNTENNNYISPSKLILNNWIFSIVLIFTEKSALSLLQKGCSLKQLVKLMKLDGELILHMLNLLIEYNYVTRKLANEYILSPNFTNELHAIGEEKLKAQLQSCFGKTQSLINSIRDNNYQHGWSHADEILLQAQGKVSEVIVTDVFNQSQELKSMLNRNNLKLLDIGAGVGRISIKFAELYPNIHITAVEPNEPQYFIANNNIEQSEYKPRIQLLKKFAHELKCDNQFDIIWLPQMFIANHVFSETLEILYRSLKPGGLLLSTTADYSNEQSNQVKLVFYLYGEARTAQELEENYTAMGFRQVKQFKNKNGVIALVAIK